MNTECMMMHMPFIYFSDQEARQMVRVIRAHVDERGLGLPKEDRQFRRPRTVFFSMPNAKVCQEVDQIFEMSRRDGLVEMPKPNFSPLEE